MKLPLFLFALSLIPPSAFAQQPEAPQSPAIKTTVDEVVLDFIVRDKKGKPITDIKPEDVTVTDNGAKQEITSFRLVRGAEAITSSGAATALDPLRQIRLVTLAFESMDEPDRRKRARMAAVDLVKGEQGTNVFYSVVMIQSRLMAIQQFTSDREALTRAIDRATAGLSMTKLLPVSDSIKAELKKTVSVAPATDTAGTQAIQARLSSIMLEMLRMDAAISTEDARMSITALQSLVQGLQTMPGRKSILFFTAGMTVPPELDVPFNNLKGLANRANVTFYSVDTRGVMAGYTSDTRDVTTGGLNSEATAALNKTATSLGTTVNRKEGAVTKDEITGSDDAERSGRKNVQLPIRDLAESTGGFLVGESNDLRGPLRQVNEEVSSYYELTYNPGIKNYDGSFRKLKVDAGRKDLIIHARNGYFALPPQARAAGMLPYEMPLLKAISDGAVLADVPFRSAAILLQPKAEATDVSVLVEVPLAGLQPKNDPAQSKQAIHFSLGALVKNSKGEVVQKLSRDRSLFVTADQLKMGNFIEKMTVPISPGTYTLSSAVMDRESGKIGTQHSEFTIAPKSKGVGISSLTPVRSYTPNAKGLEPSEPFQFQDGIITPTLNNHVPKGKDSVLRLFFTIYADAAIPASPTVQVEFLQAGNSLTKVDLPLPPADPQGRIPYVMTVPAAAIPPGDYDIRAIAKQGESSAEAKTTVTIEP
jgi:VWFA-related protein